MSDDRSRQRLGRGLASLIGPGAASAGAAREGPSFSARADVPSPGGAAAPLPPDRSVALDRVHPNPRNPRRRFDETELAELAASLKVHGVVQPLLVRPRPGEPGAFEIVAGERRWRAAGLAGLAHVPVVVREIDDRQSLEIALIENVQRADLDAVEEAHGFQALIDEHGYAQADLAEIVGKSRSHVANTLRLLKLPESVQAMISSGALSAGHARAAVTADDPEAFARYVAEAGLSVRQAEELARRGGVPEIDGAGQPGQSRRTGTRTLAPDEESERLGLRLSQALGGARVAIRLKGNEAGGIRIEFRSREELDAILRLIEAARRPAAGADGATGPRIREL